jgi:hypothetical protein
MLALCRERAEREGLSPTLYAQAMHELELPRRYRTIIVCGGFGLGGTRAHDVEALRRLHGQLEPGGLLLLDNQVPYANAHLWQRWPKGGREDLPADWPPPGERRRAADGAEYELRSRLVELDPLEQRVSMEILGEMWRDGELVARDIHVLKMTVYFKNELLLMLERAGFDDITVRRGYEDADPSGDDDFLVFVARK